MVFMIGIRTSLFIIFLGKSSSSVLPTLRIHRDDVPYSYEYSTMNFYDKDYKNDLNGYRYKTHYQQSQRNGNLQYTPMIFNTKDEEILSTFYMETTTPAPTELPDLPREEVSTNENIVEPQFYKQYTKYKNENEQEKPVPLSIRNTMCKVVPKIVFKSEISKDFRKNDGFPIRNKINQSYSSNILSGLHQEMRPISENVVTESYETLRIFKHFHQKDTRIATKRIHVLPALQNDKVQPILNPYSVKGGRLHLNIARALNTANGHKKAPENGHQKRISINKLVPQTQICARHR